MSDVNNAVGNVATIGAHVATMLTVGAKVGESKNQINNKYKDYITDNLALRTGWQGDTAQIFVTYSNCMNNMLKAAIGTTDTLLQDITIFSNETKQLDEQAATNAGGEK